MSQNDTLCTRGARGVLAWRVHTTTPACVSDTVSPAAAFLCLASCCRAGVLRLQGCKCSCSRLQTRSEGAFRRTRLMVISSIAGASHLLRPSRLLSLFSPSAIAGAACLMRHFLCCASLRASSLLLSHGHDASAAPLCPSSRCTFRSTCARPPLAVMCVRYCQTAPTSAAGVSQIPNLPHWLPDRPQRARLRGVGPAAFLRRRRRALPQRMAQVRAWERAPNQNGDHPLPFTHKSIGLPTAVGRQPRLSRSPGRERRRLRCRRRSQGGGPGAAPRRRRAIAH